MKTIAHALVLLLGLGMNQSLTWGQTPVPAKPTDAAVPQVAFLPLTGLSQTENSTFHYEAGAVDPIRVPHWERTFTLKNTTSRPVTLTRLRGSCGCETLLLLKNGKVVPTDRLAPGEEAAVHLSVNLHGGQSGPVRKYVWVDGPPASSGQNLPVATLEVDLLLQPSVTFLPSSLSFGKVAAGAGASQPLTVSYEADLLPGTDPPRLVSSRPEVQAKPTGSLEHYFEGDKPRLRQAYQVTLSPSAHAGPVSGELGFDLPPVPGGATAATRVQLLLSGEVAGALDVLPASVFFGSVPAGTSVTRLAVLSTASPSLASSFNLKTSASWLQAVLNPAAAPAKQHLLSITLTTHAPVGPLQGTVTVTMGKEDHLDIPVIAELTPAAK